MANLWVDEEHAAQFLERRRSLPHIDEAYENLLAVVPSAAGRILDLGAGDGHLVSLLRAGRPDSPCVLVDFSDHMLDEARRRFADADDIEIVAHDLAESLPHLGRFDVVVSSFAIHHLEDARKRTLYAEIYEILEPGGSFFNLEHVASPTETLHERFREALDVDDEEDDPSNILVDVESQLTWLRDIGFDNVDCLWKWRELALLAGEKPGA